jgi:hypothetical protein
MKKQTAVEWIHHQLTSTWFDSKTSEEILRIAMESEKLQIKKAFIDGRFDQEKFDFNSEEYYQETYGKK